MKKSLAALAAAGSVAVAMAATMTTASAQDYWNGGWHVGGDYYQASYYQPTTYGSLYDYVAPAAAYGSVSMVTPMRTVQTIETVRTIRPAPWRSARRVVTRQTTISQVAYPSRTLYDYAAPAPAVSGYNTAAYYNGSSYARPIYDYAAPSGGAVWENVGARPLYDTVMPVAATNFAAPMSGAPYYRYTYLWDRILVIDPATGLLVRSIPR
jgi:hypothetical protein